MTIETRPIEAPAAPAEKTVADVLRHAALIIEERGWCQNAFENRLGAVCMDGALGLAERGWAFGASWMIYDVVRHFIGASAIGWNDTPGRTASEVTSALRAAADAWERDR